MKIGQTTLTLLLLQKAMADKAGKVRSKESKGKKGKGKSGKGTAAPSHASTDGPTAAPSRTPCTSATSFNNTGLKSAVRDYFGQGCLTDNTCAIIIQLGDIGEWKTCEVTSMQGLFATFNNPQAVDDFNEDLNNWNVSKVTEMYGMFIGAKAFNQPMNNWDVSKVTSMDGMFNGAAAFNQPMNNWDVSKVTSMYSMFFGAAAFNQPLNDWDVSNVLAMYEMFGGAAAFNQNLCDWGKIASFPYSAVTDMFMGSGCTYKADPTQATKGPFCADDCTAVFV
jgi:surface protein